MTSISDEDKDGKKVLAIIGSPRRNGNTEILVDEILKGAMEKGASTQKLFLTDFTISPCKGCDSCKKIGKCVQKDDMTELLTLMRSSDIWVFGTPVYWWGPTAQFKIFLDRWHGIIDREFFKGKETILVIPLEEKKSTSYDPLLTMFKSIMDYLGMVNAGTILATGVYDKGAVREYPEVLVSARKTGRKVMGE
jgi:multimeric flavodoxin WrbA